MNAQRQRWIMGWIAAVVLGWSGAATAQTITDYTAYPPFAGNVITPNVLLLLDNSGSMRERAYGVAPAPTSYDPTVEYGGYFEPAKCYSYGSSRFTATTAAKPCGSSSQWDGNFLNWVATEKIEIAKWVMMGGKCAPRVSGNCYPGGQLQFENSGAFTVPNVPFAGVTPITGSGTQRCFARSNQNLVVYSNTSGSCSGGTTSYSLVVDISSEPKGLMQQVGTKARFGLMEFKGAGDGGQVLADVGSNVTSMVNAIENTVPSTWTPLAESLYEATRYFAQIPPAYANSDYSYNVANRDPYYFDSSWINPAQTVPCCKSFVIIFTDGEPTQDLNVPSTIQGYAASFYPANGSCPLPGGCTTNHSTSSHNHGTVSNHFDNCSIYYGGPTSDPCQYSGSHYLDDVAYWAHTTDLRQALIPGINAAGKDLAGMQNLTIYTFFAFGQGSNILKDAAKLGGFNDLNGDGKPGPDPKEWDVDGNGVPDTYFESADAFAMRERLMAAITDILKRSASGTSVSILSTSSEGDGALYQAYFYPTKFEGINEIKWLGYLRGLFLDAYGNLREDTNKDGRLVLKQDRIVQMILDSTTNEVKANLFDDLDEDGKRDSVTPVSTVILDDIAPIWEAGKQLALRDPNARTIYTWVDSDKDGIVDNGDFGSPTGEAMTFSTGNESTLRPYLRAASATEGTNIINFIRGAQVSGYRDRCLTVSGASAQSGCTGNQRVWKLGDIITSTPTVVASVKEQYDLVYGDATYSAYRKAHTKRRNVVYVGANDGLLHAFNGGVYNEGDDPSTSSVIERGWFEANPTTGSGWGSPGLGEELWAFAPFDNLPHLKWLTQTDYTHVYYVDLKPKVSDVRIFNDAATGVSGLIDGQVGVSHPNGWGTILIAGLRFGGGAMNVTIGGSSVAFRSAYYAFDVTDPEKPPRLLWRFTDPGLGFSTSYPALMHFKATSTSSEKWYMVVGSGPDNNVPNGTRGYDGSSTQTAQLFVVNLLSGTLLKTFATDANAFMGDPSTLDGNLDYNVDTVYAGNVVKTGSTWTSGKLYRLVTKDNADPTGSNWALSTLINVNRPILAAPALTKDALNNLWVFAGTGRFISVADKASTDQQTIYGIKDPCWTSDSSGVYCTTTYTKTDLLDVTNVSVKEVQNSGQVTGSAAACGGSASCSYSDLVKTARSKQGWYLDLASPGTPSERVLAPAAVLGGIVLLTSFTPNGDLCALLGDSAIYALYFESGTAYYKPVIGTYTDAGVEKIKRSDTLGKGMPTTVGLAIGKETKGFVQTSTGIISEIETDAPGGRSRIVSWSEGGGAMSEVQAIYEHVVK